MIGLCTLTQAVKARRYRQSKLTPNADKMPKDVAPEVMPELGSSTLFNVNGKVRAPHSAAPLTADRSRNWRRVWAGKE